MKSSVFSLQSSGFKAGTAVRLAGSVVVLEPLSSEHEQELFYAARYEEIWRWMDEYRGESPESFHFWFEEALAASEAGKEQAFCTLDAASGQPIGSTRYLNLRPVDRCLEIGWTWLTPAAWGTGANIEAKLLMLEHAFESMGCVRVEMKTDARNERSRRAMAAIPAQFEGIHRKHKYIRRVGIRDTAWYSIIDHEWPGVKANLQHRLSLAPSTRDQAPGTEVA